MRYLYIIVMVFSAVVLLCCVLRTRKDGKILARKVGNLLLAAMFSIFANIGLILAVTEQASNIVYALFFISFDWLIYNLLSFIVEYTNYGKQNAIYRNIVRIVLSVDTCSFLLHLRFHHAFGLRRFEFSDGTPYFHVTYRFGYQIHLAISYILLLYIIILLLHKIYFSPAIYRKKYDIVGVILLAVILTNAVFVFTNQPYDVSMLLFAVGGFLIYYYSLIYIPNELLDRTLSMVVQGMNNAVILLDVDENCIYHNQKAETFFQVDTMPEQEWKAFLRKWTGNQMLSMCKNFTQDCTEAINGKIMHLHISFHRLADQSNKYLGSFLIIDDRTTDVEKLQDEHYRATHDRLTGLYNCDYFYEKAEKCMKENPNERFLMICSDIWHFRQINDIFGMELGDNLLLKIAEGIRGNTRPGEIFGRLEKDRFAILIRKKDYNEQKLLDGPREFAHIESDYAYPVYVQIGVYEIVNPDTPVGIMCDRALLAIGSIKDDTNKKIAYYNESLRGNVFFSQKLKEEAAEAIRLEQIQIYLQPQIDISGELRGAEVLARWEHPERGLLMPNEFLPIFEKNGLMIALDQYVWELACRQLRYWKEMGREDLYLSINISPKDFYFVDVVRYLQELVHRYDIAATNLKIEITEATVMAELNGEKELMTSLHQAGFTVELDNFGNGYSSLNLLKSTGIDILKFNMDFLMDADSRERARIIIASVLHLAEDLHLAFIAKGVETEEQLQLLEDIGCASFQGYYFSQPLPISEFESTYLGKL